MSPHAVRHAARAQVILLLAIAPLMAQAQSEGATTPATQRSLSIVPTFSTSMTLTDNAHLSAENRQADLILQVSPGIQITSNSGRVR
ncbi:MAG: hypothetical protein ABIQ60_13900, partial [Burkholderiaceae bacterium]